MEYLNQVFVLVTLCFVECLCKGKVFTQTDLTDVLKSFSGSGCPDDTRNLDEIGYYRYLQKSDKDSNVIYVGAMNYVYKLQLSDMTCLDYNGSIPSNETIRICSIQGKKKVPDCQNHIRVVMEMNNYLLVCGTGGFAPIRYHLNTEWDNFQINNTFPGAAYCPFDPWDNYTAILVTQGNPGNTTVPYFGTYTDFIKSSPVISRPKFTGSDGKIYSSTSTDREDISWLNFEVASNS